MTWSLRARLARTQRPAVPPPAEPEEFGLETAQRLAEQLEIPPERWAELAAAWREEAAP